MTNKCLTVLGTGICAFISFTGASNAQSTVQNTSLFIPAVYPIENAWNTQNYDFMTPVAVSITTESTSDTNVADSQAPKKEYKPDKDKDIGEELIDKLPFKNTLKYTWDFIDGDTDLYFEGLRFDRGNRGLEYKTNALPYFGNVEGMKIKAEVGEKHKVTFETDYMPLVGRIEGLNLKATAGSKNAVSFRYSKSFP